MQAKPLPSNATYSTPPRFQLRSYSQNRTETESHSSTKPSQLLNLSSMEEREVTTAEAPSGVLIEFPPALRRAPSSQKGSGEKIVNLKLSQ